MRRPFTILAIVLFTLMFVSLLAFDRLPQTPIAKAAAPPPSFFLYLPLITRSCAGQEMIRDTSFEAGLPNTNWLTSSNQSSKILDGTPAIPAHTGVWKALLGGSNLAQESVAQSFSIAAGTGKLQIVFWFRITTSEPSPATFDRLDIQIRNSTGASVLETVYSLYDGDRNSSYASKTVYTSSSYAGQTVQLAFVANTDASNQTSFLIDDVSVQICTP